MKEKLEELETRNSQIHSPKDIDAQHAKGKLTAEERLDLLLDKGSFTEIGAFATHQVDDPGMKDRKRFRDGVITGFGRVDGRPVFVFAQDFTFMGASMGEMHTRKIAHLLDLALGAGAPVVGLLDSGGARIQEGIGALDGGGAIFLKNTQASGRIPQLSAIMGPCAGIASYSPALTDFVFMTRGTATMFITGPNVIRSVIGEEIDAEALGGADVHASKSGVAHFLTADEPQTIDRIRRLLSFLPSNCSQIPPYQAPSDDPERLCPSLEQAVPVEPTRVYNVRKVVSEALDKDSFLEIHDRFAKNVVVGLGRLNGHVVGIVANQPMVLAGCIDINASVKIARFVNFCDSFNIPIVNFVDVTGFLPGSALEHNGIIRHGAKVLHAYSRATVPKISLVLRKAYGGAYIALVSKDMGFDKVLAWPTAEIAVMGADQAVAIVNRKELEAAPDKEALRMQRIGEYRERFCNPWIAASENRVDIVLEPAQTRRMLIRVLEMLLPKRDAAMPANHSQSRKHGSIPL